MERKKQMPGFKRHRDARGDCRCQGLGPGQVLTGGGAAQCLPRPALPHGADTEHAGGGYTPASENALGTASEFATHLGKVHQGVGLVAQLPLLHLDAPQPACGKEREGPRSSGAREGTAPQAGPLPQPLVWCWNPARGLAHGGQLTRIKGLSGPQSADSCLHACLPLGTLASHYTQAMFWHRCPVCLSSGGELFLFSCQGPFGSL